MRMTTIAICAGAALCLTHPAHPIGVVQRLHRSARQPPIRPHPVRRQFRSQGASAGDVLDFACSCNQDSGEHDPASHQ